MYNCTSHVILLNPHCESPGRKKAPSALLCVNWGVGQLTFRNTATISRLKTCDDLSYFTRLWWSLMVAKQCCWKRHLWRQRPSQQDRPQQTPARAKRRSFSDKKKFHGTFLSSKVFKLFTKCTLAYLERSKLADVSEHLVVVKIPPPHPHWEAFPGPVKKNSLMLK